MIIRKYIASDCEQLAELFYQTVHAVNSKDYTQEQLCVWATGHVDLAAWNTSFLEHTTYIAVKNKNAERARKERSLKWHQIHPI